MPFDNWLTKLNTSSIKELQCDLACKVINDKINNPFSKVPESILLQIFDEMITECGERGIDLVKIYSHEGD